jgi:hypothetical protein
MVRMLNNNCDGENAESLTVRYAMETIKILSIFFMNNQGIKLLLITTDNFIQSLHLI